MPCKTTATSHPSWTTIFADLQNCRKIQGKGQSVQVIKLFLPESSLLLVFMLILPTIKTHRTPRPTKRQHKQHLTCCLSLIPIAQTLFTSPVAFLSFALTQMETKLQPSFRPCGVINSLKHPLPTMTQRCAQFVCIYGHCCISHPSIHCPWTERGVLLMPHSSHINKINTSNRSTCKRCATRPCTPALRIRAETTAGTSICIVRRTQPTTRQIVQLKPFER